MNTLKLVFLLSIFSTGLMANERTYFRCDFYQPHLGKAQVSGHLDQRNGQLTLSGDALLDNSYSRKNIAFHRQIRVNENTYKFSKYTGSTLFYFYTFSVPKGLEQMGTSNFKAYITAIREGVGGKQDIELSCQKTLHLDLINSFVREYRNLITYYHLKPEHRELVELISLPQDLPKTILETLSSLNISLALDWDFFEDNPNSYIINFSASPEESDAMAIVKDGETIGYIFNVTECNIEECYGWDALYLGANGTVIFKSF